MNQLILLTTVLMYAGIVAFPRLKAWISLGAALVLIVAGAVDPGTAIGTLINWNILLIYLGSLILAELFIYSRVPAFIAERIVERSPSVGVAITIILFLTGLISAFVENVATVLVVAPVMIELARRGKKSLGPLMVGLAVMANLQGVATLVGDPPSMLFANFAGYSFNDFFFRAGKPSVFFAIQIASLAGAFYFFLYFRKSAGNQHELPPETIVSWFPTALLGAMIGGLALVSAFSAEGGIHPASGLLVMGLAVLGLGWQWGVKKDRQAAKDLVVHLDWDTLAFLVGIFIVIGVLGRSGMLDELAGQLARWAGGNVALGYVMLIGFSVLISGFVDNVPYIAAMLPVAASLARAMNLAPELYMFGLLIGSCIGGNLTPFGASANIVAVSIAGKQGTRIGFGEWLKIAGPFTVLTTAVASLFTWIVWR